MKKVLCALMALALCLVLSACGSDEENYLISKSEDYYINDVASVLAYETRAEVYFNSKALDEATGAQIVVVTTRTLGNDDIEDFASKLFNQWGVGDSKKNNGILLLMKPADTLANKNYFVSIGTGASNIIGDAELRILLDENLYDDFVAGNYDAGTLKTYKALFERVRDYYNLNLSYQTYESLVRTGKLAGEERGTEEESYAGETETVQAGSFRGGRSEAAQPKRGGISMGWIIFIIAIIVIIVVIARRRRRGPGVSTTGTVSRPAVTPVFINTSRARRTPPPPPGTGMGPRQAGQSYGTRGTSYGAGLGSRPAGQPYGYRSASPASNRTYRSVQPPTGVNSSTVRRSSGSGFTTGSSASRPSVSRSSTSRSSSSVSRSSVSRPSSFGGGRSGGGRTSGGGAGMRR